MKKVKLKCPKCKKKFTVTDLDEVWKQGLEDAIKAMEDLAWEYRLKKKKEENEKTKHNNTQSKSRSRR